MTLGALGDTGPGEPAVALDGDGYRSITWPLGRAPEVALTADLFEALVAELNLGRRALVALTRVVAAVSGVMSPPDNPSAPPPPVDTP